MSFEHLITAISTSPHSKEEHYKQALKAAETLCTAATHPISIMANMAAFLHELLQPLWTGFYRVAGERLVLFPFQGGAACTYIGYGKGVCGKAWETASTIIVEDVENFPGHIACSSLSKSEIVVPVFNKTGGVEAVIDIDSTLKGAFDATDAAFLEKIARLMTQQIDWEQCR